MSRIKSKKQVGLSDVAEDAGISRATASLVMRGSSLVAESTRRRVLASKDKLGYVYNRTAASLRTNRSNTIGLIVNDVRNPFYAEFTIGVEKTLDKAQCLVYLVNTSENIKRQDRILKTMQEYRTDGILLCPAVGTPFQMIKHLQLTQFPLVLTIRDLPGIEVDYVGADNVLGAEMAVEYLIDHGHSRIAFLGGYSKSSSGRDRLLGFKKALQRQGLPVDEPLIIPSEVSRVGGRQAILKLLDHSYPPSAALCYNDVVAFGAIQGLWESGRVPGRDMAIIGFDAIAEATLWRPPLSNVSIQPETIGVVAAGRLLEKID